MCAAYKISALITFYKHSKLALALHSLKIEFGLQFKPKS